MKLDFRIKSAYRGTYFNKPEKNTFWKATFNDGQYSLIKNDEMKHFALDKWSDYYNILGYGVDTQSWTLEFPFELLNLTDFHKMSKIVKSSKCRTEEEFSELLKNFLSVQQKVESLKKVIVAKQLLLF